MSDQFLYFVVFDVFVANVLGLFLIIDLVRSGVVDTFLISFVLMIACKYHVRRQAPR